MPAEIRLVILEFLLSDQTRFTLTQNSSDQRRHAFVELKSWATVLWINRKLRYEALAIIDRGFSSIIPLSFPVKKLPLLVLKHTTVLHFTRRLSQTPLRPKAIKMNMPKVHRIEVWSHLLSPDTENTSISELENRIVEHEREKDGHTYRHWVQNPAISTAGVLFARENNMIISRSLCITGTFYPAGRKANTAVRYTWRMEGNVNDPQDIQTYLDLKKIDWKPENLPEDSWPHRVQDLLLVLLAAPAFYNIRTGRLEVLADSRSDLFLKTLEQFSSQETRRVALKEGKKLHRGL